MTRPLEVQEEKVLRHQEQQPLEESRNHSLYPSLYQVNTRVWLTDLSRRARRPLTLDDIPDTELDRIAKMGFDWVWFLSVWQTGDAGRQVSRNDPEWRKEFHETLPDLCDEDIPGSGFAITGYSVHPSLGGNAALARLRERLRKRRLRLMLDFVPNHTGLDHPWVDEHPEYYLPGTEPDLARAPKNYIRISSKRGDLLLAHGRDPYFPGWPDTLQLNYGNPATQKAMAGEILKIAGQCDGVRCDMAMLILPDVFERTWGLRPEPFWPKAIEQARAATPDFVFMAEVYWDMEWTLQQQGFDYAYDKRLYDRLREGHPRPAREHLLAGLDYQNKLARFLENHDEPRAAAAFPPHTCEAAAVITFLAPGLRFFHQGQFEGRTKRISPHLCRAPDEPVNSRLARFYDRLLAVLRQPIFRHGKWQLLQCAPAWDGNGSCDAFIAYAWLDSGGARIVVAINYSDHASQCYLRLPFSDFSGRRWRLHDLFGEAEFDRDGNELHSRGLYLDMTPWEFHAFNFSPL
jgi:glycosidase